MELKLADYKKMLEGCWMGKTIGGTLGAPLECYRGEFNVSYYMQELKGQSIPNDDLDLQLIWLNAVEKHLRNTNAGILGEYWTSYEGLHICEYGAGMVNLKMGMVPPLSGYVDNIHRHSCGAFIRSEIWACITPGHPDLAAEYAFEDAIVDHNGEGVFGEIFCAVVQSAAFIEKDKYKLIDIGLSYIPKECGTSKGINCVLDCKKSGLTWQETRKKLLNEVPGSFGMLGGYLNSEPEADVPIGNLGYDAPSNVGIVVLGLIFGDDFDSSIRIAVNCGEDTDCTAGTLGSILGIISGIDGIPDKWKEPIASEIKTFCINLANAGISVPKSLEDLTDRILRLTPHFLGSKLCDILSGDGYYIKTKEKNELCNPPKPMEKNWRSDILKNQRFDENKLFRQPFYIKYDFTLFSVELDYTEEPFIKVGQSKRFKLKFKNNIHFQQWLTVRWYLPEGWQITPGVEYIIPLRQSHACSIPVDEVEFEIVSGELKNSRYDLVIEISSQGRHSKGLIPVVLYNGQNQSRY